MNLIKVVLTHKFFGTLAFLFLSLPFLLPSFPQTQLWDVSTAGKLQQLSMGGDPTLDLAAFQSSDTPVLTALTESKLHVFQWEPTS